MSNGLEVFDATYRLLEGILENYQQPPLQLYDLKFPIVQRNHNHLTNGIGACHCILCIIFHTYLPTIYKISPFRILSYHLFRILHRTQWYGLVPDKDKVFPRYSTF